MRARSSLAIRRVGALVAGCVVVAACSNGGDGGDGGADGVADTTATTTVPTSDTSATTTPATPAAPALDTIELELLKVVELDEPIAMAARPSSPDLYIAERGGEVRLVKVTEPTTGTGPTRYQLQTTPVLDISDDVLAGGERGLLGIAFSSDGRKLYVNYTARPDGDTRVEEFELGDRSTALPDSRRLLLTVQQPAANHNGGHLAIGPDGYLYIGLGDGGGQGDPKGNSQNRDELLGKILRIDPEGAAADGDPAYGIPAGNPYSDGEEGAREVWLYGVRNPWRFSFDALTGDLWIGDVGQNNWEEIDRLPSVGGFDAGRAANLGWDRMEGTHSFEGDNPPGAVLPVFEYSHDEGCSITGGHVYRGSDIEPLQGAYLFTDFCASGLRGIRVDGDSVVDERRWPVAAESVFSFAEDNDGEIFVLLGSGPVLKLVAADDG